MIELPEFKTNKELFDFIVKNKETLIAQKRATKKTVDCSVIVPVTIVKENKEGTKKELNLDSITDFDIIKKLEVVVIINTTNFFDRHRDVHIPGIWNKSLKENKYIMHVQEHDSDDFEKIISSGVDLKAYTKKYTWAELGYAYEGETEALTFNSLIRKERNEFMLKQYAHGWVVNHSVGMQYVRMDYAINDDSYPNEYEAWQKYYPIIANKEDVDQYGYFCYVLEAKIIEGSAVPLGSNSATPTISVEQKGAPDNTTLQNIEPPKSTHKTIDYSYLKQNVKL